TVTAARPRRDKGADVESGVAPVDGPFGACRREAVASKYRCSAQATAYAQWSRRSTVVSTELATLHRGLSAEPLFRLTSQRSTDRRLASPLSAAPLFQRNASAQHRCSSATPQRCAVVSAALR